MTSLNSEKRLLSQRPILLDVVLAAACFHVIDVRDFAKDYAAGCATDNPAVPYCRVPSRRRTRTITTDVILLQTKLRLGPGPERKRPSYVQLGHRGELWAAYNLDDTLGLGIVLCIHVKLPHF